MNMFQTFELSTVLDSAKFHKIFDKACDKSDYMEKNGNEYNDHSLNPRGIMVVYRDSQYKKKIKILANTKVFSEGNFPDPEKFIRKLDKRIREYFGFKYEINDFTLSGMITTADIDVGDSKTVSEYLKVLQRIGRVKGFSPVSYDCFEGNTSVCMEGNSNSISFLIYDLRALLMNQLQQKDAKRKVLKPMIEASKGILRSEVRLTKPKAIRAYTEADGPSEQIRELIGKNKDIFLETFTQIIPFGNFYKKDKAVEIIRSEVKDNIMMRKMLRLLTLIPEKKSLYLAEKSMNCRNIDKIVESFAEIGVSPVTLSKRHDIKYLENLYKYVAK